MQKEYASGAVIFRREGPETFFLLVYSERNALWGFPKGHIESGENERSAALREIEEETGLRGVSMNYDFRIEDVYRAVSNREPSNGQEIEKHSIYFLGEAREKDITVDNAEITAFRWTTLDEALSLLAFDGMKTILLKASDFIRSTT